ncbi:MAG: FHA domain-containing protein [Gammaproteobacteria bacterium]|nr:FHA domain-containing protein [Gammaproteobacteria bacterium]
MALIIEALDRTHRVQGRLHIEGEPVTLGRAYHNALIMEDPHVDAVHAEIRCDNNGHYILRDLNTTNGTHLLTSHTLKSTAATKINEYRIQSGDEFQIGKSRLRCVLSESKVAPTLPLHTLEVLFDYFAQPRLAIGLCILAGAVSLWLGYLTTINRFDWISGLELITQTLSTLIIYAAFWAFIGRVVRHEARFFAHLSIAAIARLLIGSWSWFSGLLRFNYSSLWLISAFNILALAFLLPALLWCASFLALNIEPRWRWIMAVLLPWCFLALIAKVEFDDLKEFSETPRLAVELKPDKWLWRKPVSMDAFLTSTPALFEIPLTEKNMEAKPSTMRDTATAEQPQVE